MSADAPDTFANDFVKVLMVAYEKFDFMDFAGPAEVLSYTRHEMGKPETEAFDITIAGPGKLVRSHNGFEISTHIDFKEAHERLDEFDIMIIPGGAQAEILKDNLEPIPLIKAFVELQQANPKRERTLFSVCVGSLLLAQAGALQGMVATTHPDYDIQLEKLCQTASAYVTEDRTEVLPARYVVNNARFAVDVDELDDEEAAPNPFIQTRAQYMASRKERRKSHARKGSFSLKQSMTLEENVEGRKQKRLGGLRVITAGGVTSGIDAALYIASAYVSVESAEEVARLMQFDWVKGVVVDSIDF